MRVDLVIEPTEPKIRAVLIAPQKDEEAQRLFSLLEKEGEVRFNGYRDSDVSIIYEGDIVTVYAENKRVFCRTNDNTYELKARLYELEKTLDETMFVRISNSEIVNAKKIQKLDISISGTIGVLLTDGTKTFASRRHVKRLKEFFGV